MNIARQEHHAAHDSLYFAGQPTFEAVYLPSSHPTYTGNPLIDALPPLRSKEEWVRHLLNKPTFDRLHLEADSHVRSHFASEIKYLFVPTGSHTKLAMRIEQIIRSGYHYRAPQSPERVALLQESYARMQKQGKAGTTSYSPNVPICSYSLIGGSGMGKSTSIERVLGSFPQVIHHPEHHLTQIVWLKVDCPKGGSVADLAVSIVSAFDRLLGTSTVPLNRRNTYEKYFTEKVSHFAVAHHLGVLVLDEMQNLSAKRSGGREIMLNWFQELVNKLKVPIVLLGTYKATNVLQLDMRHARRAGIFGSERWDRLPRGPEFEQLVRAVWQYQWLRQPGPLTDEMKDAIYQETQGIRAFIVDMFLVAQLYALWKGDETLTPALFKHVARKEFSAVQTMLNALRSGDPARIRKFDDLAFYDVDDHIERLRNMIPASSEELHDISAQSSPTAEAATKVAGVLSISQKEAMQLVMKVTKGPNQSVRSLTTAALLLHYELNPEDEGAPEKIDG